MYDYLDLRQTERLKELVPYKALAPDADEIIEELERLNNIINELEKWCNNGIKNDIHIAYEQELDYEDVLDKLKELKEDNK
jgi:hypothetical protein